MNIKRNFNNQASTYKGNNNNEDDDSDRIIRREKKITNDQRYIRSSVRVFEKLKGL